MSAQVQSGELDEIVVTAERRETSLQRTPITIAALDGDALRERGIDNIDDLSQAVTGLSAGHEIGQMHIAIRGIGSD